MTNETLQESNDSKRVYEVGYLLSPSIPEEQIQSETEKIRSVILSQNGSLIAEGAPELRPLAYSIARPIGTGNAKFNSAYFGWMKFEVEATGTAEIKAEFGKNENLIRFLIMRSDRNSHTGLNREGQSEEKTPEREVSAGGVDKNEEIDKSIEELMAE